MRKQMVQSMDQLTDKTLLVPESNYEAAFGRVLSETIKAAGTTRRKLDEQFGAGFEPKKEAIATLKIVDPNK